MSTIEDFGEKIHGAAKDRWKDYARRCGLVRGDAALSSATLAEAFPEANYKSLLKNGADPWVVAFVRSLRDMVPDKPREARAKIAWGRSVDSLRGLALSVLEGRTSPDYIKAQLENDTPRMVVGARIALYMTLGHENSLKDIQISSLRYKYINGQHHNPPKLMWVSTGGQRFGLPKEIEHESITGLVDEIVSKFVAPEKSKPGLEQQSRQSIAQRLTVMRTSRGTYPICINVGKRSIVVTECPDLEAARKMVEENLPDLIDRAEKLLTAPRERRETNDVRLGPERRAGRDVTVQEFEEAFRLRGVQFGEYVNGPRRQEAMNNAYDALMDLSAALDCPPSALSLGGSLGLAFGARGRGGRNAAAAHYEPGEVVINLTRDAGAGSLAHEWFHALDNHIGRRAGSPSYFSTEIKLRVTNPLQSSFNTIMERLGAETKQVDRSTEAARYTTSDYFMQFKEIAARAFEGWVIDRLEALGIKNDYLANVYPEAAYDVEHRIMGYTKDRYVYPRASELPALRHIIGEAFVSDGPIATELYATAPDKSMKREVASQDLVVQVAAPHIRMVPEIVRADEYQPPEQYNFDF